MLFMPTPKEVEQLDQLEQVENSDSPWKGLTKMYLASGRGVSPHGYYSPENEQLRQSLAVTLEYVFHFKCVFVL